MYDNPMWTILEKETDRFRLVVDALPEHADVGEMLDPAVYDIESLRRKINRGELLWFRARVRVMMKVPPQRLDRGTIRRTGGIEIGRSILGGNLYEDPDGFRHSSILGDIVREAVQEARHVLSHTPDLAA